MRKKFLISVLLFSLFVLQLSCCANSSGVKLTRKQKKEFNILEVAKTNFDIKQYDVAIEYYTKAISVNPENAETYYKRGNAEFLLGNYQIKHFIESNQ